MPNQRKRGKEMISAWIPDEVKRKLERIAELEDVPLSAIIDTMIREGVDEFRVRGAKLAKKREGSKGSRGESGRKG